MNIALTNILKAAQRLITFPIGDAEWGELITGAAGLSARISKDGGAFAAATNSVTELAEGYYTLTLTATEMNADTVAIKIGTTTAGAKVPFIQIYTVASSGAATKEEIAAEVWDTILVGAHDIPDSAGKILQDGSGSALAMEIARAVYAIHTFPPNFNPLLTIIEGGA